MAWLSSDLKNLNEYLCKRSLLFKPHMTQFIVVCKPSHTVPRTTSIRLDTTIILAVCQASTVPWTGGWQPPHIQDSRRQCVSVHWQETWSMEERTEVSNSHCSSNVLLVSYSLTYLIYASVAYVHSLTQFLSNHFVKSHLHMKTILV